MCWHAIKWGEGREEVEGSGRRVWTGTRALRLPLLSLDILARRARIHSHTGKGESSKCESGQVLLYLGTKDRDMHTGEEEGEEEQKQAEEEERKRTSTATVHVALCAEKEWRGCGERGEGGWRLWQRCR
jgi:hypothetical protein